MECPNCGLFNTESAQRCDCGYDLRAPPEARAATRKAQLDRRAKRGLAGAGILAAGLVFFWFQLENGRGGFAGLLTAGAGLAVLGSALRTGPQKWEDYVDGGKPRR